MTCCLFLLWMFCHFLFVSLNVLSLPGYFVTFCLFPWMFYHFLFVLQDVLSLPVGFPELHSLIIKGLLIK